MRPRGRLRAGRQVSEGGLGRVCAVFVWMPLVPSAVRVTGVELTSSAPFRAAVTSPGQVEGKKRSRGAGSGNCSSFQMSVFAECV